jgi:spore coat-associated protein N
MSTTISRRVVLGVGALSVAFVGAAGLASSALFTSTDSSTGNSFTTGTVVLNSGGGAAVFTVSGMAPGDVTYGKVPVANDGSLQLRYAMTSSSSNADSKGLASAMTTKVVPIASNATCNAAAISGGTAIYSGALSGAAFGDPAAGAQTGDRTLAANASEALCVQVTLPTASGNAYQAATTSTSLTFAAEQTLNNA